MSVRKSMRGAMVGCAVLLVAIGGCAPSTIAGKPTEARAKSDKPIATLSISVRTSGGTAYDPTTRLLYLGDGETGDITVVDMGARAVRGTISVGSRIYDLALDPASHTLYAGGKSVAVINTTSNTVTASIPVDLENGTSGQLALDTARNTLYATDRDHAMINVIDTVSNTVKAKIERDFSTKDLDPLFVAVSAGTNTVYVAGRKGGTSPITTVDASTNQVTGFTPGTVDSINQLLVDEATNSLYIAGDDENAAGRSIMVIDTVTHDEKISLAAGGVDAMALDAASHTLYVLNAYPNSTVTLIDTTTNKVKKSAPVVANPNEMAIDTAARELYLMWGNQITVSELPT